jgi:hypothetical protein
MERQKSRIAGAGADEPDPARLKLRQAKALSGAAERAFRAFLRRRGTGRARPRRTKRNDICRHEFTHYLRELNQFTLHHVNNDLSSPLQAPAILAPDRHFNRKAPENPLLRHLGSIMAASQKPQEAQIRPKAGKKRQ